VFARLEVRHLRAVIFLAEEMNFTRAADRLHITQSALSKQINDIERQHRFHLFTRRDKKMVELTEVGRIFVEETRAALLHIDRAVRFASAARDGGGRILTMGHSPDADLRWISAVLGNPSAPVPELAYTLLANFSSELVRSVMAGDLDLALVTAPPEALASTNCGICPNASLRGTPEKPPSRPKGKTLATRFGRDERILFGSEAHPSFTTQSWTPQTRGESLETDAMRFTRPNRHSLGMRTRWVAILTKFAVDLSVPRCSVKSLSDTSLRLKRV